MSNKKTTEEQYEDMDNGADFFQVTAKDYKTGEWPWIYETLYLDEAQAYMSEGIKKSIERAGYWYFPELEWSITWCYDWQKCPETGDWIRPKEDCIAGWTNGEWWYEHYGMFTPHPRVGDDE